MSHDIVSRKVFGITHETIVSRILRTFDRATASDIEAGATWYDEAGDLAASLAVDYCSVEEAACLLSHLSPRTSWSRNVAGAAAFKHGGVPAAREVGCLGENVARAAAMFANGYADPFESFGKDAHKTRNFARNIAGDREAVTVDVWAARVADLDETLLKRVGAYDAIAHAYRLAARRRGVSPATMQATTWIVARNGRAS